MTIVAPTSGVVIDRHLVDRQGTFVEEGDELLVVDDHQSRCLRISLAEEDIPRAGRLSGQPVRVRIGTRPMMQGVVERLIPRASRRLPAKSLAATAGGALAVRKQASEDDPSRTELELTEHRFVAVVRLPDSASLPAGERGYATLGLREESLGGHLYRAGRDWLEDQVQLARDAAAAAERG